MDETNSRTAFCCEIFLLCSLVSTVYIGSVQSSEAAFYGSQAAARRWLCTILSILRKTFASAAKWLSDCRISLYFSSLFPNTVYLRQPWMNQSQSVPSLWPTNYPAFLTSHCLPSPLVFFACLPSFSILFAYSIFNKHNSPYLNTSLLPTSTPHFSPLPPPIFTSLLFLSAPYSPRFHPLPFTSLPFFTPSPLPALPSPPNPYFFSTLHLTIVLRSIPLHSESSAPSPSPSFPSHFFVFSESFSNSTYAYVYE
jgi:hypothetical protein